MTANSCAIWKSKTYGKDELAALKRDLFREMEGRIDRLMDNAMQ